MRGALLLLASLALGGCDPNASAAACDGGPTLYAQCTSVYQTYCAQGPRCSLSIDPTACLNDALLHCPCAAEACDAGSCGTAGMVSTCQQELESEDCNAIVNFPSAAYWPVDCTPFLSSM